MLSIVAVIILFSSVQALQPLQSVDRSSRGFSLSTLPPKSIDALSRKDFFSKSLTFITALTPLSSLAATEEASAAPGVSQQRIADILHAVPTFCLVDEKGVPYMVVGEDAKVTGYFFVDFDEARRILELAKKSADAAIRESDQPQTPNPWKHARISTLPLDVAVTLATKSASSINNDYFRVAPSSADIEDALAASGQDDLAEGKVPLFYYANFMISGESPLYLRKSQLEAAYRQQHKDGPLPALQVTELFAVLGEMSRGTDSELQTLVLQSLPESEKRQKECQRRGGKESPFVIGQVNIVL